MGIYRRDIGCSTECRGLWIAQTCRVGDSTGKFLGCRQSELVGGLFRILLVEWICLKWFQFFRFSRERGLGWPVLCRRMGWIVFLQNSCPPRTSEYVTLFGIRVFAGVIKIRAEKRPSWFRVGPASERESLYKKRRGQRDKKGEVMWHRGREGSDVSTIWGTGRIASNHHNWKGGMGQILPQSLQKKNNLADTSSVDLGPPKLGENLFFSV